MNVITQAVATNTPLDNEVGSEPESPPKVHIEIDPLFCTVNVNYLITTYNQMHSFTYVFITTQLLVSKLYYCTLYRRMKGKTSATAFAIKYQVQALVNKSIHIAKQL